MLANLAFIKNRMLPQCPCHDGTTGGIGLQKDKNAQPGGGQERRVL